MTHPFRFGVQLATLPPADWAERLRRIEAWGYDSVFWPDHFGPQWEPVAALAAAAAVTTRLKVGSLVYGIDYRHPIVLAKAAATIQLLSGGRHEFGIGAGWMESDYREAGMSYDRAGLRIERLEEAIRIIRDVWRQDKTSFEGRHYRVKDAQAAVLPRPVPPRILIGGGGPKVLAVAGRHADIVGVNPKVAEERVTAAAMQDATAERTLEKVRWVREAAAAAGRDPNVLEWNALVFVAAVSDDPKPLREVLAKNGGMTPEQVAACPLYLTGTASEIRETLEKRREAFGISYVVIQGHDEKSLASFAEQVATKLGRPLSMVKLAVDFEHPSRSWWENGGQALWDGISDGFEGSSVVLDASVAASWLAEASRIPGWGDRPEYAPHPIRASQADEEDLDL